MESTPNKPVKSITAAILAGGKSSRMGLNKALLRLPGGGPTLIETVARRLLDAGLEPPLLVTNQPEDYAFLGLRSVPDDVADAGALGGILTALNHCGTEQVFVVACDMPLLNPALVRHICVLPGNYDAVVPRWTHARMSRVEPLHALYSVSCAGMIEQQIMLEQLKVGNFLSSITVRYVEEEELRGLDPHLLSFCNVNTPEDWAKVLENIGA